ncbi:related to protein involved in intramitochondrial protein sorting [Cephalotrichum gorgonifer]|uniref:Related to protein involved in intramitochondrial protein sorting n=1 Tax=Cephalotrichum gorgonifer TaxID=2041049 RepID=A0AAE8MQR3_9PEZI|nr:related to protein involved in intramitochondrial protein sorting [Cephalotrichum gorgonifer]
MDSDLSPISYGCLYNLIVEVLPVPGISVLNVVQDDPFPVTVSLGTATLMLVQVRLCPYGQQRSRRSPNQATTPKVPTSESLFRDLEKQLGELPREYLRLRLRYSHSGFVPSATHDLSLETHLETIATSTIRRKDTGSLWTRGSEYGDVEEGMDLLMSIITRHWEVEKARRAVEAVVRSREVEKEKGRMRERQRERLNTIRGSMRTLKRSPGRKVDIGSRENTIPDPSDVHDIPTTTMRWLSNNATFNYSWEEVSVANWQKYGPWNNKSTHVVAVDTLSRRVDPATGILRTERLITVKQSAPDWVKSLLGSLDLHYMYETSYVDIKNKTVTMVSQNLTWSNFVSVQETVVYRPLCDSRTQFEQHAKIMALCGGWQRIKNSIEDSLVTRFKENAHKGREGFEMVLEMSRRAFAEERERQKMGVPMEKRMTEAQDDLLAIGLSDSDDHQPENEERPSRTGQSAEAFAAMKREYTVKLEDGEIWKGISVPLRNPSKQEMQAATHAVEELYYFRRYEEASGFLRRLLEGAEGIGTEARAVLEGYGRKCEEKLGSSGGQ